MKKELKMKKLLSGMLALTLVLSSAGTAALAQTEAANDSTNILYSYQRDAFTNLEGFNKNSSGATSGGGFRTGWDYGVYTNGKDADGNPASGDVKEKMFDDNSTLEISLAKVGINNYLTAGGSSKTDYPYVSVKFMIDPASYNTAARYRVCNWLKSSVTLAEGIDGLMITNGKFSFPMSYGSSSLDTGCYVTPGQWYTYSCVRDFSEIGKVYCNHVISDDSGIVYQSGWILEGTNTSLSSLTGNSLSYSTDVMYAIQQHVVEQATQPTMYIDDFDFGWYKTKPVGFFSSGATGNTNKYLIYSGGNGDGDMGFALHSKTTVDGVVQPDDYTDYEFEMDLRLPSGISANSNREIFPFAVNRDSTAGMVGGIGSPLKIKGNKGYFMSLLNAGNSAYGVKTVAGVTEQKQVGDAFDFLPGTWYNIKMEYKNTVPATYVNYQEGETYPAAFGTYKLNDENVYEEVTNIKAGDPADTSYYKLTDRGSAMYTVTVTNKETGEIFKQENIPFDNINICGTVKGTDISGWSYNSAYRQNAYGRLLLIGNSIGVRANVDNLKIRKSKTEGNETVSVDLMNTNFEDYEIDETIGNIFVAEKTKAYGTYSGTSYERGIWTIARDDNAIVNQKVTIYPNEFLSDMYAKVTSDNIYRDSIFGKTNVSIVPEDQVFTLKGEQTLKEGCVNKNTVKLYKANEEECPSAYSVSQAADNKSFTISFSNTNPLDLNTEYKFVIDKAAIMDSAKSFSVVDLDEEDLTFKTAESDDSAATIIPSNAQFTKTADSIAAEVTLTSTASATNLKYLVVLAVYDSTETKLLGVSVAQDLAAPGAEIPVPLKAVPAEAGSKAKLFVWESWDSMKSYCAAIPYNN